jgi:hypothetical protein
MSDFIDDGYSVEATIEAEEKVNGELSFSYRPALPEQVAKLFDVDGDGQDSVYMATAINMLSAEKGGLLLGWDLKDRKGAVVPINRENVAKVRNLLLRKIINKVFFGPAVESSVKN